MRAAVVIACSTLILLPGAAGARQAPAPGFQVDLTGGRHIECWAVRGVLRCLDYSRPALPGAKCDFGGTVWTARLRRTGRARRTHTCVDEGFHDWQALRPGRTFHSGPFRCRLRDGRRVLRCRSAVRGFSLSASGRTRGLTSATAAAIPATMAAARLKPSSRVSTRGLGPVRIGMDKATAERAARMPMRYLGPARYGCRYMRPTDRRIRATFMLQRGRVVRVDVGRRGIATPSGVRVGDSEASVRRRFAGQLRIERHAYTDGYYLEFVPEDRGERNRRVVFETTRGKVSYIRAGRLPEVRYIEGCS